MANRSNATRDHEEIRRWAEERGGKPAHVKRTGSEEDIGVLRIEFPGFGGDENLEPISWEDFFAKFDERASFGTWLYRIAANCSLDLIRARKRRSENQERPEEGAPEPMQSLADGAPTPERLALSGEVEQRLAGALDDLSEMERAAFVLRHYEGMCIDDISRTLGVQPNAAKHSVFRAVQKLRRALEPLVSNA